MQPPQIDLAKISAAANAAVAAAMAVAKQAVPSNSAAPPARKSRFSDGDSLRFLNISMLVAGPPEGWVPPAAAGASGFKPPAAGFSPAEVGAQVAAALNKSVGLPPPKKTGLALLMVAQCSCQVSEPLGDIGRRRENTQSCSSKRRLFEAERRRGNSGQSGVCIGAHGAWC